MRSFVTSGLCLFKTVRSINKKENIEIDVELTSGLNVVIGGSSSGKTLLVDSIVRCITNKTSETKYKQYCINEIKVENPSGMTPHYFI
jgi:predicted ATP-dependent endonuclease of OLD family